MARKYKIKRKQQNIFLRMIPEPFQRFLARRIFDVIGLSFILLSVLLSLSLFSYDQNDPSWNSAGTQAPENWMGAAGAKTADILLQTVGLGSGVFALGLLVWGIGMLRRRSLSPFWLRPPFLIFSAVISAGAFARLPSFDILPQAYFGGAGGQIILQQVSDALGFFSLPYGHSAAALICASVTLVFLSLALPIRRSEWAWVGAMIWALALRLLYGLWDHALGFMDWVIYHNRPEDAPKRTKQRTKTKLPEIKTPEKRGEPVLMSQDKVQNTQLSQIDPNTPMIEVVGEAEITPGSKKQSSQGRFRLFDGNEWMLPTLDLLQPVPEATQAERPDENALRMNAELLQNVLSDFNIEGEIVSIHPGPVVTLYELEPAAGVKTSRVIGLADDIARSMSAVSVRAAVVPGRNVIGIEMPNKIRQTVYLRELLATRDYEDTKAELPLILGKDIGGAPVIADLARMPHLLVAGTTGSGKSVAVNTMILSLLYNLSPEKCRFIMIDPKMLELSVYDDIPHLLSPVVTDPGKAVVALKWAVQEMEDRYRAMSKLGVRNIEGYNARLAQARKKGEVLMRKVQTGFDIESGKPVYEEQELDLTDLPYIVIIVDEFADLMLVAGKDVENAIQRLAQMARAAGIHLIMATQRPSVDVITGVIKANFPTRISFAVTSKIDSRTILGEGGAEQLLGMGDMLYMAAGGRIRRVHGPFSSDEDVENVVGALKEQGEPAYLQEVTDSDGDFTDSEVMNAMFGGGEDSSNSVDELYDQAVAIVARERKASTSFIQRHLQIGYNRAARIVEEMEKQGVISPATSTGKREVLIGDHSGAA